MKLKAFNKLRVGDVVFVHGVVYHIQSLGEGVITRKSVIALMGDDSSIVRVCVYDLR